MPEGFHAREARSGAGTSLAARDCSAVSADEQQNEHVDEDVEYLTRFFFALPEPIPLPDCLQIWETVGNSPSDDVQADDPWVLLRFHQRETRSSWIGVSDAIFDVVAAQADLKALRSPRSTGLDAAGLLTRDLTVVEAITTFHSPDDPPADWDGRASVLPPRADALNRCIHAVQDHVRAYRLASKSPYGPLSYERLAPTILAFRAVAPWVRPTRQASMRSATLTGRDRTCCYSSTSTSPTPSGSTLTIDWPPR